MVLLPGRDKSNNLKVSIHSFPAWRCNTKR